MNILKKASLVVSTGLFLGGAAYALPTQGSSEVTFSGVGQSDQEFDNGTFAFEGSYGYYYTERVMFSLRQRLGGIGDGEDWNGSTLAAVDYHFTDTEWRPFLGINAGVSYGGDFVGDSFAAGAQAGLKYYIKEDAFFFMRADYTYTFDDAGDADDAWDQGSFGYAFGIGLNF